MSLFVGPSARCACLPSGRDPPAKRDTKTPPFFSVPRVTSNETETLLARFVQNKGGQAKKRARPFTLNPRESFRG